MSGLGIIATAKLQNAAKSTSELANRKQILQSEQKEAASPTKKSRDLKSMAQAKNPLPSLGVTQPLQAVA